MAFIFEELHLAGRALNSVMSKNVCNIKQAVILAGGRGVRLRPLTDELPKPLVPANGIPFLDYLINSIFKTGISHVVLLLGYKSEKFISYCDKYVNGVRKIDYSVGKVEDATGRRLINAYDLLDENFLLLYADNYWPIEREKMARVYKDKKAKVMVTVFSNKSGTGEYGKANNVEIARDGFVKRYDKKMTSENLNGIDIGFFVVSKDVLYPKREGNISFEEDMLPEFIARKQLAAYETDTQYYSITNINTLKRFENYATQNDICSSVV